MLRAYAEVPLYMKFIYMKVAESAWNQMKVLEIGWKYIIDGRGALCSLHEKKKKKNNTHTTTKEDLKFN